MNSRPFVKINMQGAQVPGLAQKLEARKYFSKPGIFPKLEQISSFHVYDFNGNLAFFFFFFFFLFYAEF